MTRTTIYQTFWGEVYYGKLGGPPMSPAQLVSLDKAGKQKAGDEAERNEKSDTGSGSGSENVTLTFA